MSLLQILFLPGYLFLSCYHFKRGILQTLILSFGLSLSINYCLVLLLTTLHLYTHAVILSVFAVELFFLGWQLRPLLIGHPVITQNYNFQELLKIGVVSGGGFIKQEIKNFNFLKITALFFALYLFYYYLYFSSPANYIFTSWDPVVSWNQWAVDWYHNHFPIQTYEYPQLLPANISLTYQFMGNSTVQLFAKGFCFVFPFIMIAALWDSATRQKNAAYYAAVSFLVILFLLIVKGDAVAGYADTPVACMTLLGFYALMLANTYEYENDSKKSVLIAAILIGSAAVTKQAGAIYVLLFPLMLYFFLFNERKFQPRFRMMLTTCVIMLFFLLPWYIYKFIQIYLGTDLDITNYLIQGGGYLLPVNSSRMDKIYFGMHQLLNHIGINNSFLTVTGYYVVAYLIKILFAFLLILGCYFSNFARKVFFLMALPGFLIWLLFVSYDFRNIAVALPFLAITLGIGFERACFYLKGIWFSKKNQFLLLGLSSVYSIFVRALTSSPSTSFRLVRLVGLLLIFVTLTVIAANSIFSSSRLINSQLVRQKQVGYVYINQVLYKYFDSQPLNGVIMSNYMPLPYLPGFEQYYAYNSFRELSQLVKAIQITHPAYLIIWRDHTLSMHSTMSVENYVLSTDKKHFKIIEQNASILFCKVNYT
ncbi:MAG: hypothetical protein HKM04_10300 [Legionellales bacterium]|nr:hypothetical protein [Legionellales bacterium]